MALNNLARQTTQTPQPFQATPDEQPLHKAATRTVKLPKYLATSKFEKCLLLVCSLMVVTMMVWLVSLKIGVSSAQQRLQDVNTQITNLQTKNTNKRQEINELSNRSRLEKIANKDGLSLSNNQIRNVNK